MSDQYQDGPRGPVMLGDVAEIARDIETAAREAQGLGEAYHAASGAFPEVQRGLLALRRASPAHRADAEAELIRAEREAMRAGGRELTPMREAWDRAVATLYRQTARVASAVLGDGK